VSLSCEVSQRVSPILLSEARFILATLRAVWWYAYSVAV
jgi:hypothetical protein